MSEMKDLRFDWDDGNWPKCGKHGLTQAQIEEAFQSDPLIAPDPNPAETRWRAIGRLSTARLVFVVFTYREVGAELLIRPISARYMHAKEVKHYERR
jgi:uncharacterized DUF497 family protein